MGTPPRPDITQWAWDVLTAAEIKPTVGAIADQAGKGAMATIWYLGNVMDSFPVMRVYRQEFQFLKKRALTTDEVVLDEAVLDEVGHFRTPFDEFWDWAVGIPTVGEVLGKQILSQLDDLATACIRTYRERGYVFINEENRQL